jgi:hypothetical protein
MVDIALSRDTLEPRMQYRIQLWCGAALNICGALYAVGLVVVARLLFPVPNPNASAIEIAAFFAQHSDRIRLGALIMVIGIGFFAPWGAMLVARTRLLEGRLPIFTYMSATTFGATLLATFLVPACFAIAAFRTWNTPEIPQMLNDAAWYLLLYIWPLFTVWIFSFGIPILTAPEHKQLHPRWVGHFSLVCGALFGTSFLVNHVKTGPFAYDGFFGVYVPAAALGLWGTVVGIELIRAARDEFHATVQLEEDANAI